MNNATGRRRVQALRDLPAEIAPPRDLWPGLQPRLAPRARSWVLPASLAAGVMLLALGLTFGSRLERILLPATSQPDPGAMIRAAFQGDPFYQRRTELLKDLPARLAHLPPESAQRVEESLRSIQRARQDIEAELGREAGNVLLQELLVDTYQEEMRLLTVVSDADEANPEI